MKNRKIYIVASYTNTWPGRMIVARASLKFWNRYDGDRYSHISISLDKRLTNMYSFARKEIYNPFNSGLINESIYEGMFARNGNISQIAVFEIAVTETQYTGLKETLEAYWEKRNDCKFNYLGLFFQLMIGRGCARKNHFFCSQWVASLLQACGVCAFPNMTPPNIRPFDFYSTFHEYLIYEGLAKEYYTKGIDHCAGTQNT